MDASRLRDVVSTLFDVYGPQHWWPADTAFEVMIGAVLTQNTAWTNVERALERLKARIELDSGPILGLPLEELADALRPAGYFNVKARRLMALCEYLESSAGLQGLARLETSVLREALLGVKGVGPETADDILLYAFDRPVFVVDAYTRRLFSRLGLLDGDEQYEAIRAGFESALGPDAPLFNEYHALIVRHAKLVCRSTPDCRNCVLRVSCPTFDPIRRP